MSAIDSRWETEQLRKPAALMSDEEWEAHKRYVDEQRASRGEAPLDWRSIPRPRRTSEHTLAYLRSTANAER